MIKYRTKILGLNKAHKNCFGELRTDENIYKFSLPLKKQVSMKSIQKVLKS
jgi:hypothetical protein